MAACRVGLGNERMGACPSMDAREGLKVWEEHLEASRPSVRQEGEINHVLGLVDGGGGGGG